MRGLSHEGNASLMSQSQIGTAATLQMRSGTSAALPALCGCFGPLIYADHLAAVIALMLLAIIAAATRRDSPSRTIAAAVAVIIPFVPLLAWMAVSSAWALDTKAAAMLALRVAAIVAASAVLIGNLGAAAAARQSKLIAAVAIGFCSASLVVLLDLGMGLGLARTLHAERGPDYDEALFFGRAATIHAILVVPLTLGLLRRGSRRLAGLHAALAVSAILMTASLSAKTALALGLASSVVTFAMPWFRWVVVAGLAAAVLSAPIAFPLELTPGTACWLANHKPSALHRVYIWNFVAARIAEKPVLGWGLDAARRMPGGDARLVIRSCDAANRPAEIAIDNQILPLHPHNGILQVWLELGGVGAALGFGALVIVLGRCFAEPAWRARASQAAVTGAIVAALSVSLISFGVWQEWFLAALGVVAAIAAVALARTEAL